MLEFMDLGVENIRGSNHPPTLSGKIAYLGEDQVGRCLPWMAYTYIHSLIPTILQDRLET